jgi:hypothetical protein
MVDYEKTVSNSWRVKLYQLEDEGTWKDRGTGSVTSQYVQDLDGPALVVISEDTKGVLLQSRIPNEDIYERQNENIILWREPDAESYIDLALSFQDTAGCQAIWKSIQEVQSHYSQPSFQYMHMMRTGSESSAEDAADIVLSRGRQTLPYPTRANLADVRDRLQSAHYGQKETFALTIMDQNGEFLRQLIHLASDFEEEEDMEAMHKVVDVWKAILLLNDANLIELILSEDIVIHLAGAMEYDPALACRANYREYLGTKVKFRQVGREQPEELKQAATNMYRLRFIKDFILRPAIDETGVTAIISMINFLSAELCNHVFNDEEYLESLLCIIDPSLSSGGDVTEGEGSKAELQSGNLTADGTTDEAAPDSQNTGQAYVNGEVREAAEAEAEAETGAVTETDTGYDNSGDNSSASSREEREEVEPTSHRKRQRIGTGGAGVMQSPISNESYDCLKDETASNGSISGTESLEETIVEPSSAPPSDAQKADMQVDCSMDSPADQSSDHTVVIHNTVESDVEVASCGSVETVSSVATVSSVVISESDDGSVMAQCDVPPKDIDIDAIDPRAASKMNAMGIEPPSQSKIDGLRFYRELFQLSRTLSFEKRLDLYSKLLSRCGSAFFATMLKVLGDPLSVTEERLHAVECVVSICVVNPGALREVVLEGPPPSLPQMQSTEKDPDASGEDKEWIQYEQNCKSALFVLIRRVVEDTEVAVIEYTAEVLRTLLDSDRMDKFEKDRFLAVFYDHYLPWLVTPFMEPNVPDKFSTARPPTTSASGKRQLIEDRRDEHLNGTPQPETPVQSMSAIATSRRVIFEILCCCVQYHSYRMKYYVMRNNLLTQCLRIFDSVYRHMHLGAIRLLRAIIALKEEFYQRHIVKFDIMKPLFCLLRQTARKDNMITSTIVELVELVRAENMQTLIVYIMEKYSDSFDDVLHVDTFDRLRLRHEQNLDKESEVKMGTGTELQHQKMNSKLAEREMEESYLLDDDGDEIKSSGEAKNGTPRSDPFALIAGYGEDEDGEGTHLGEAKAGAPGVTSVPIDAPVSHLSPVKVSVSPNSIGEVHPSKLTGFESDPQFAAHKSGGLPADRIDGASSPSRFGTIIGDDSPPPLPPLRPKFEIDEVPAGNSFFIGKAANLGSRPHAHSSPHNIRAHIAGLDQAALTMTRPPTPPLSPGLDRVEGKEKEEGKTGQVDTEILESDSASDVSDNDSVHSASSADSNGTHVGATSTGKPGGISFSMKRRLVSRRHASMRHSTE